MSPSSRKDRTVRAVTLACFAAILSFALSGCGDDDSSSSTEVQVPDCSDDTSTTEAPDSGTSAEDGDIHFIPASCGSSLFRAGVDEECAAKASATVKIDGQTHMLGFGCHTKLTLDDWYGHAFEGFLLKFVGDSACDPMLTIGVLDDLHYGDAPFTADLDDRLCDGSKIRVTSITLRWNGRCYALDVPATGSLSVEEMATNVAFSGTLDAELTDLANTEERIDFEASFSLEGMGLYESSNDLYYVNLCEAE